MEEYIQKLEWLKEWIALKIDNMLPSMVQINIEAYIGPAMSWEDVIKIFQQTGVMYYRSTEPRISNSYIPMNFEQYCQHKLTPTTTLKQYSYE